MNLRPTASSAWSGQQDVSGARTDFGLRTFKDAFMTLLRIAAALLLFIGATLQRMKRPKIQKQTGEPHFVPLAKQALVILSTCSS